MPAMLLAVGQTVLLAFQVFEEAAAKTRWLQPGLDDVERELHSSLAESETWKHG